MSIYETNELLENIETVVWYLNPNVDPNNQKDFVTALSNLFDRRIYEQNGLSPPETCPPIYCSDTLIANKINVILENFSSELADHMAQFKEQFPRTQYVVILTEFLATSTFGYRAFNCFNFRDTLWALLVQISLKKTPYCGSEDWFDQRVSTPRQLGCTGRTAQLILRKLVGMNWFLTLTRKALALKRVRRVIARVLKVSTTEEDRAEFEIRLDSLFKIQGIVSRWLTILPCQVGQYHEARFQNVMLLPLLFDNRVIHQIKKRKKGIFCSKSISSYRCEVFSQIQAHSDRQRVGDLATNKIIEVIFQILGGDQITSIDLHESFQEIDRLEGGPEVELRDLITQLESCRDNNDCVRKILDAIQDILPDIYEVTNAYQNDRTVAALPQIELYIPKSKDWPYSSPMRTFKALINGCQPMSFGHFDDHELESLTQKIAPDSIDQVDALINDASCHLDFCDVEEYHRLIYPRALKLTAEIVGSATAQIHTAS